MRAFALVGLLFVLAGAIVLVVLRAPSEQAPTAALWMQGFSLELDAWAARHEGAFPGEVEDLLLDTRVPPGFASHAVDPWGRAYVYERHPVDPQQCRVYTLGDPQRPGERDSGALALYRDRAREQWRRDLDDVPRAWTDAQARGALGE